MTGPRWLILVAVLTLLASAGSALWADHTLDGELCYKSGEQCPEFYYEYDSR